MADAGAERPVRFTCSLPLRGLFREPGARHHSTSPPSHCGGGKPVATPRAVIVSGVDSDALRRQSKVAPRRLAAAAVPGHCRRALPRAGGHAFTALKFLFAEDPGRGR